jgi:hypothetical protein
MTNNRSCKNCKKKFYSSKGKENCGNCMRNLGLRKPTKTFAKNALKRVCQDVQLFKTDIHILATKQKWGLISPIDRLRVVDVYMNVVCNEAKYSTNEPEQQVQFMLIELLQLLDITRDYELITPGKGRIVVHLDSKTGQVIKEYRTIREASIDLDYGASSIKRRCDGLKCVVREVLKWKKDI